MSEYKQLQQHIRDLAGPVGTMTIYQGIVTSVSGCTCEVQVGRMIVSDVRLRASETDDESEMLVVPKVGTAVTLGSLSGDLAQMVVLQVDHVESITINGGRLGGLINIEQLTAKVNALVDAFNSHTHVVNTTGTATAQAGTAQAVASPAQRLNKADYEDTTIKH
ncbi:MAG: hypothetical protein II844_03705 [Prevotella sp.]|nr:hypothetical protein [Prevotella sp.]